MRTLSIKQPWANLICCGLKDVENRKWALKSSPVRVLIHCGAKRDDMDESNMPYLWWLPVENYQTMGILPNLNELPTSAIVGVATIDKCLTKHDSIWAQEGPGAEYKWVVKDVKLFKEPILNVKGKLGIYETPGITEGNLPECVDVPKIERDGTHIRIPLCREIFDQLKDENSKANTVALNLVDENLLHFADDFINPLPTDTVTFFCGDESIEKAAVTEYAIEQQFNKKGNPIVYEDARGNKYDWYKIFISI